MYLSALIPTGTRQRDFSPRVFPEYANPCPPLWSFPGVIRNTSTIWEHVLDLADKVEVKKGNILYPDEGKTPPFYYLKKGKLCVYLFNEKGEEFSPHYIFSGSLINDGFWILNNQINPHPVKTLEDCEIYLFDRALDFQTLLNINPALVQNLMYSQAVKDICYSRLAYINAYKAPTTRVSLFLYEMYRVWKTKVFTPGITQAELANLLHMHKVTVSNTISELKTKGIIKEFTKSVLHLLEPEKLREHVRIGV